MRGRQRRWFAHGVMLGAIVFALRATPLLRPLDPPSSGIPRTSVQLPPEAVSGEWISAHVVVSGPIRAETVRPLLGHRLGSFEVLAIRSEPVRSCCEASWQVTLITFESGQLAIPPMTFAFRLGEGNEEARVSTDARVLRVAEPHVVEQQLRPLKTLRRPGIRLIVLALVWALLIVALVLFLAATLRWRRRGTDAVVDGRIELQRTLDAIERLGVAREEDLRACYTSLAWVLRMLLERDYDVPTWALSTPSLLQLASIKGDRTRAERLIGPLLGYADHVRFGRYHPTTAEHQAILKQARELLAPHSGRSGACAQASICTTREVVRTPSDGTPRRGSGGTGAT